MGARLTGRSAVTTVAVLGPIAVCALLLPLRGNVDTTNFPLVLVLVIVAVAAKGDRLAGVAAALSAGVWFDFFFTEPYERFTISGRADVETAVLLLAVGIGVTELAGWGRRQHALAERDAGFIAGIGVAAGMAATGGSSASVVEQVSRQITAALSLRQCRFEYGVAGLGDHPRLRRDGEVEWRSAVWDVDGAGLPTESELEVLVESHGLLCGRFLLTASAGARPSLAQRRMTVALADQVGAVMGRAA